MKSPEKSALLTGLGIATTFIVGFTFTLLLPSYNLNWSSETSRDQQHYHLPYTALQLRGHLVYQREACMYCHTQQIRPLVPEMERYSIGTSLAIPSDEREYVYDAPHFLGTRRIGPDLSREGGKYSDDWHYSHFVNPRQMTPGSIMPAFTWLFYKDEDGNYQPKPDARALVAYIQTLGYERQIYDKTLNGGKGGWRCWLKASDQQESQAAGVNTVLRAAAPIRTVGQKTPANLVNTPPPGKL